MPMSPPPPSPQHHFPQLVEQRASRREALAKHKQTVMEFSAHIEQETTNGKTPLPTILPTRAYLNAAAELEESSEDVGLATNVLSPKDVEELGGIEHDPIADGFAALRVQRTQRKQGLRELKRTAANVNVAQQRTRYIPPHAVEKLRAEFNKKDESESD